MLTNSMIGYVELRDGNEPHLLFNYTSCIVFCLITYFSFQYQAIYAVINLSHIYRSPPSPFIFMYCFSKKYVLRSDSERI